MTRILDLARPSRRLALLLLVSLCVGLAWVGAIDERSAEYIDGSLLQAGVAFATARALNALISVMQSTTLSFSLFAGVHVTLGELLDPFNDLIEQYSSMMQLAIGSLVIQKILLDIVSDLGFKIVLTASAVLLAIAILARSAGWSGLLLKSFVLLLFLRFALVVAVLLNGVVDQLYIDDRTRAELAVLGSVSTDIELIDGAARQPNAQPLAAPARRELESQRSRLQSQQHALRTDLAGEEAAVVRAQSELQQVEAGLSLLARLNPFNRSPAQVRALAQLDAAQERLDGLRQAEQSIGQQIERLQREMLSMAQAQQAPSSESSLRDRVARLGEPETYRQLQQKLESLAMNIVTVMALFCLKTLILPLLFLYGLSRGAKWIWRLDMRLDREANSERVPLRPRT